MGSVNRLFFGLRKAIPLQMADRAVHAVFRIGAKAAEQGVADASMQFDDKRFEFVHPADAQYFFKFLLIGRGLEFPLKQTEQSSKLQQTVADRAGIGARRELDTLVLLC